jgi:small subunit ribosomal protein S3
MIIAMRIARGLQTRKNCNSTMRTHMQDAVRRGVNGIKILCSGRLNGAEIASSTSSYHGKVPKHTIRANISYAVYEANTSSGKCGIKVWINNAKNLISVKSNSEDSRNLKNSNNFRGAYSFRSTNNVQSTRGAKS